MDAATSSLNQTLAAAPTTPVIILPEVFKERNQTDAAALTDNETASLVSALTDLDAPASNASGKTSSSGFKVRPWNGKTLLSDFIAEGLRYQKRKCKNLIMLFETTNTKHNCNGPTSPDSSSSWSSESSDSSSESSYSPDVSYNTNSQVYKFHEYVRVDSPVKSVPAALRATLAPCRYSLINGSSYPVYYAGGNPPRELLEHWKATIPRFQEPSFCAAIDSEALVYAYLPMDQIQRPLNDPRVHYHLAGKDAIGLMTTKTTKLYKDTKEHRPCICKTTHSMASKGIFVIHNDDDEAEFQEYLQESGLPSYIVTQYISIVRNVACHFFIHPSGEITWFGSNENHMDASGQWTSDSHIVMADQEHLQELQLPFVQDVVNYCHSLGFWGCCGVDVLLDASGTGYLVDVNPRVTGSCPAILTALQLQETHGFEHCLFRRSLKYAYPGSAEDLLDQVQSFNQEQAGQMLIVLYSYFEVGPTETAVNIGVHGGPCIADCAAVLDRFAPLKPEM